MSAHFSYQHMPAGGVGILDDQYRPYASGGIGAAVPAHATKYVGVGALDARPLLFPPEIHVGEVPIGIPTVGSVASVNPPVVLSIPYLDVVQFVLGLRPVLSETLAIVNNLLRLLSIAPSADMLLTVEPANADMLESPTVVSFTVGVNMGISVKMGVVQSVERNLSVGEDFSTNLTQTLDY